MIEKIVIKNKEGKTLELTLDEFIELKSNIDSLDSPDPQPYSTYWPTTSPGIYPWLTDPVMCKAGA